MIYHITTLPEWRAAHSDGLYRPANFDSDGFIHCSDLYQVKTVANSFYKTTPDLVVLQIDPELLESPLVYENLEGGEMTFPHIYGLLPVEAVGRVFELIREEDGALDLPIDMRQREPALFNELPYARPGRAFRSPTPGSHMFDPLDEVLQHYLDANIDTVFVLNPQEEFISHTGSNLLDRYQAAGLNVVHAPTADFSAPPHGKWDDALRQAQALVNSGKNIAVHCHAGIGRTGMFAACLAQDLLDLSPNNAIAWVRQFIPGAVETQYQVQFVRNYKKSS